MSRSIAQWLFLLLVVSLPLVRPFNTRLFGLQTPFTDFIFIAVFLFTAAAVLRREIVVRFDRFYFFIGLYAAALALSTVFSEQPGRSVVKLAGEFYLFALALVAFHLALDKSFFPRVAAAWLTGTVITAAASLAGFVLFYAGYKLQSNNYFLSHFGSLPAGNYPRIHALFANANMMCNYLNVSLMFALWAERSGRLKKTPALLLQAGIWASALFTFSPGLGGMFLSAGIWYWNSFRERGRVFLSRAALAGGAAAAVFFAAAILVSPDTANTDQNFSLPLTGRTFETSVRVLTWQSALDSFYRAPLTGRGTGIDPAFVDYETLGGQHQQLRDAHNVWLSVLGQSGLAGFAAFLLLSGFLASKMRIRASLSDESASRRAALSCALIGAFFYQGLSGSFEDARHLWILFGLLAAAAALTSSENDSAAASPAP
jgi:putative inorganic carbon (hco3(-)) transporter